MTPGDDASIDAEDRALAHAIADGSINDSKGYPAFNVARDIDRILYSALELHRDPENDDRDLVVFAGGSNDWFAWMAGSQDVRPKTIREHAAEIDALHKRFSRLLEEAQRLDQRIRDEQAAQASRAQEFRQLMDEIEANRPIAYAGPLAKSYSPDEEMKESAERLVARRQELAAERESIDAESLRLAQEYEAIRAQMGDS